MSNSINTNNIPLGKKLRIENGRLYFGEAPGAPVATLVAFDEAGCHAADLDLSCFQPCYDLIRSAILDLTSRGEVPGLTFSVNVDLDKLADALGRGCDDSTEARARYALDSIRQCGGLCCAEEDGSNFGLLSVVGIECDGHGRYNATIMSPCINRIAADALTREN